ncbi:MAG TPA: hypothetical protein VFY67_11555 [Pyrinomonadaceae bacterium]|nr:hypothetical protein [Pyrinomonadaceae bacterium]
MGKKQRRWARPAVNDVVRDLQASDEVRRGESVRSFCPCHAGWEVFEQHVTEVLHSLKDGSRVVRAHALHVFDDAARMQSVDDLHYSLEPGEKKLDEKRACSRFRSMEERVEARRDKRLRRHKGRHEWHRT